MSAVRRALIKVRLLSLTSPKANEVRRALPKAGAQLKPSALKAALIALSVVLAFATAQQGDNLLLNRKKYARNRSAAPGFHRQLILVLLVLMTTPAKLV